MQSYSDRRERDIRTRNRRRRHSLAARKTRTPIFLGPPVTGPGPGEKDEEGERRGHKEFHEHRDTRAGRINIDIDVDVDVRPEYEEGGGEVAGEGDGDGDGRPGHTTGPGNGSINGIDPTLGDIIQIIGNGISGGPWPGPRKDLFLPYLFIRANAADTGTRPTSGPFWESPDIFILPGVAPEAAPGIPATLGGVAESDADNTIYAHIWNFGLAPAYDVLVQFYWCNPALGFNSKSSNLIGSTRTHLGARGSPDSHKVVKCPRSWKAQYINGGHECLLVRISDIAADPLSNPEWDASQNRHIGQRNIHVMSAAEEHAPGIPNGAAKHQQTINLEVGPLFGDPATVQVARANPSTMPWLHLVTMKRTPTFDQGPSTGNVGITEPTTIGRNHGDSGGGAPSPSPQQTVRGDNKQVGFYTDDPKPGKGEANVYRVTAIQNGQTVGGYTIVILGK